MRVGMGLIPIGRQEVVLRHLERFFARIPAAIAVGLLGACDGRTAASFAEPVHFSVGDSAYVISAVDARLGGLGDERVVFGSILDVDRTASGWAVVDGLARHIVLLDGDLNPVGITGQAGEGPGEFQGAQQLSVLGDTLAVYDWGTGRVSYLAPNGDFLRISQPFPVGGIATTFASHPESECSSRPSSENTTCYAPRKTIGGRPLRYPLTSDLGPGVVAASLPTWSRSRKTPPFTSLTGVNWRSSAIPRTARLPESRFSPRTAREEPQGVDRSRKRHLAI